MLQTYQDEVPVGVDEWVTSANPKQLILCSVWVARVWRNERGYRKNNLDLVIDKVCDEVLLWSEEERVGKGREIESVVWSDSERGGMGVYGEGGNMDIERVNNWRGEKRKNLGMKM